MTSNIAESTARALCWQGVRRVLAVRLDNLGDVLMTTPALAAIRDSLPGVHITLLTSPSGAAVARYLPMVDEAWPCAVPWMQAGSASAAEPAGLGRAEVEWVDRLAQGGFDAAVIFTVCTQSALPAALLCRMAGIPLRLAHCRENPYALLTDWQPEIDNVVAGSENAAPGAVPLARHEVRRQLALVASVGLRTADERLRFTIDPTDRPRVAEYLRAAGLGPQMLYAVLHPGATAESRRWPAARFGLAAQALQRQGCAVVFCGDRSELPLIEQARQALAAADADADTDAACTTPAVSLAGLLSLGELAVLIEGACVLVANNSAPAHLAAALGTPVVALYALTNPQHTPWRVASRVMNHDVPCRWCLKSVCPQRHHDCLRRVEPQQVADAAFQLMRRPEAARLEFCTP